MTARDSGYPAKFSESETRVVIAIARNQRAPRFRDVEDLLIPENTETGSVVTTLTATDDDRRVNIEKALGIRY